MTTFHQILDADHVPDRWAAAWSPSLENQFAGGLCHQV